MVPIAVREDFPRKVREIENIWIPMPDGIKLAARIWLPEDAEEHPVPAILEYLPYRKRDGTVERDHLTHPYFAGFGYAGVRVDMRGTGDSEGICLGEYLKQEQDDALVIIDWLSKQAWCSGKVGMIGISWGGFNGLQIAARKPPALGAVISLCSTDDRYADDIHFMGGCILTDKLAWGATAFGIANTPPDPEIVGDRWRDMWLERLENNGLWLLDWFKHQRRDEFYQHGSICENYADVEVPVYAVGGWMDGYTNAVFRLLENLPVPKKGLIGPWAHKYPHFAKPGPRIGFLQECLRWWDQHLKGVDTGIMEEPAFRIWVQDPIEPDPLPEERSGRWIAQNGWNSSQLEHQIFYVNNTGLEPNSVTSEAQIILNSPQNAGISAPTWCAYGVLADGPIDQNAETGLMTFFETEPLESDLEIVGFPMLKGTLLSNRPQANLAAALSFVNEDESATMISFGVLNLTHRNSHLDPEPIPTNEPIDFQLQLNACGQKVKKGQKLRLALSNAYWPIIWPSPTKTELSINSGEVRIELPIRSTGSTEDLAEFLAPEGAPPLETEELEKGGLSRTRMIDFATGLETYERSSSSGWVRHKHTGLALQDLNFDVFHIHPKDPNSANGKCTWVKSYQRVKWEAQVVVDVEVKALKDDWKISASLEATDRNGLVFHKSWDETIPRDLV